MTPALPAESAAHRSDGDGDAQDDEQALVELRLILLSRLAEAERGELDGGSSRRLQMTQFARNVPLDPKFLDAADNSAHVSEYIHNLSHQGQEAPARQRLRALIEVGLASGPCCPFTTSDMTQLLASRSRRDRLVSFFCFFRSSCDGVRPERTSWYGAVADSTASLPMGPAVHTRYGRGAAGDQSAEPVFVLA